MIVLINIIYCSILNMLMICYNTVKSKTLQIELYLFLNSFRTKSNFTSFKGLQFRLSRIWIHRMYGRLLIYNKFLVHVFFSPSVKVHFSKDL